MTETLVAIDFETSGLIPGIHGPRSLAAVCDGVPSFHAHILHERRWEVEPEADRKNGYTEERWAELGARSFVDVMVDFTLWWRRAKVAKGQLRPLAHNAAFDRAWLEWCLKSTVSLPAIDVDPRWRCSMNGLGLLIDAEVVPAGSASLDRLCELAGITDRPKAHDALWDAGACLRGYRWMLDQIRKQPTLL